jgi:hypothetical protein
MINFILGAVSVVLATVGGLYAWLMLTDFDKDEHENR